MKGLIFDIQRFSINDGPGIRTTVFMKGCPLHCIWCHNPESIRPTKELMFFSNRCQLCGACVDVCPNGVHEIHDSKRKVNFDRCAACGRCAEACFYGALKIVGKDLSPAEVVSEVKKDIPYYRTSGGGVTISGGEPAIQAPFVSALCRMLKDNDLHVALDTCGHSRWTDFATIIPYVDLILFDLKHMDFATHKRLTGASNELILSNFERLLDQGMEITVRFPLIPKRNDDSRHVEAIASFLASHKIREFDVIPYHTYGTSKYQQLGRPCKLDAVESLHKSWVGRKLEIFKKYGLKANVL